MLYALHTTVERVTRPFLISILGGAPRIIREQIALAPRVNQTSFCLISTDSVPARIDLFPRTSCWRTNIYLPALVF